MKRRDDQRLADILAAAHGIVKATITEDLPPLVSAVKRLLDHLAAN